MAAVVNQNPSQSQNRPTRLFVIHPLRGLEDYFRYRELAYGNIVGKLREFGMTPASFDVRPASPADDFSGSTFTTNAFAGDWSIAAASITVTDGKLLGSGNSILAGTMPVNRFMVHYGVTVETQGTPPETAWVFKSGSNIKQIYQLQDILGFEHPRAVSELMPAWGSSDPITELLIAVSAQPVTDVLSTLWAEPQGTVVTASNTRA